MDIAKCVLKCTIKYTLGCTPWLHCQMEHQLQRKMHLFLQFLCIFKCFVKWNRRCALKFNIGFPLKLTFWLNHFLLSCALTSAPPMHLQMQLNFYLKWTLISTSNAPSCTSLYRSGSAQSLSVPSDDPLVAYSIPQRNAPSSAPSGATLKAFCLSTSCTSSMVLESVLQGAPLSVTLSPRWSVLSSNTSGPLLD